MPTANPAAPARPTDSDSNSQRRIGLIGATAVALATMMSIGLGSAEAPTAYGAGADCSSHSSLTRPPSHIRVLRVHSGKIQRVPFRRYVVVVMGKEWPSYLPQQVVEAGAVAVKQYAWYHAVFSSRSAGGRCFDVRDSTADQLFKPERSRVRADHYSALDRTWGVTLRKNGRFFMTGYRRGEKVRCGRDSTGYKLYARSAIQCARKGYGWREILRTYYGPRLDLVGGGGGGSSSARTPTVVAPIARRPEPTRPVRSTRAPNNQAASNRGHRTPTTAADALIQTRTTTGSAGGLAGGIGAQLASAEPVVF